MKNLNVRFTKIIKLLKTYTLNAYTVQCYDISRSTSVFAWATCPAFSKPKPTRPIGRGLKIYF